MLAKSLTYQLMFSERESFQVEAGVRELLQATQINPSVGHAELAFAYAHMGLEDLAAAECQRAREMDPTSTFVKTMILVNYELVLQESASEIDHFTKLATSIKMSPLQSQSLDHH